MHYFSTRESCEVRRKWVEELTNTRLTTISSMYPESANFPSEKLRGNIERPIGLVKIPVAAAGPLLFHGEHAQGWAFAPMATTEGALIASICRGTKALNMSGGVQTWATQQRMTRAPVFLCENPVDAVKLGEWVMANRERIQNEVIVKHSKRAQLREIIAAYDMDVSRRDFFHQQSASPISYFRIFW